MLEFFHSNGKTYVWKIELHVVDLVWLTSHRVGRIGGQGALVTDRGRYSMCGKCFHASIMVSVVTTVLMYHWHVMMGVLVSELMMGCD